MASAFNADAFLQTSTKQSNDTKLIPVPEGDHPAQISKLAVRSGVKDGTPWYTLDLVWEVLDEESKKVTGMSKPTVKQGLFLDLTPEGALDMGKGKNVQLGKVREAVGQNKEGRAWSPAMLQGTVATILVKHRPDEKTGEVYGDVKGVAPQGQSTAKTKAA